MEQYIDKSAIVAEIKKRKAQFMSQADSFYKLGMEEKMNHYAILASNMQSLLSFIDTLQVKEVDLEKEMGKYLDANDIEFSHQIKLLDFARHFFELGLKAKGE